MQLTDSPGNTKFRLAIMRAYLLLAAIQGGITSWSLARIPAEKEEAIFLGFSLARLVLVGSSLIASVVFAWLLLKSWRDREWSASIQRRITEWLQHTRNWGVIIISCTVGTTLSSHLYLLTSEITEPFTSAYFVRLQPLILYGAILSGQTLLASILFRYRFGLKGLKPPKRWGIFALLIFGFTLLLWLWIALTGYGITSSDAGLGWYYLGTPILETQVMLAWGIGMGSLGLLLAFAKHPKGRAWLKVLNSHRTDLIISLILWVMATLLWASVPLAPSWFATEPRTPNFEFYPQSDASLYDTTAQNALVGMGFMTKGSPAALRPMYALFLVILHVIGGPGYEPIILMQVGLLAFFPVIIYWLTKALHNRLSAMIAAILIVLREANAIALTDEITISHSKLLMSDLPTAAGTALFILLITLWLRKPDKREYLPLIAGGVAGLFMLIRVEFAVFLPFVGLAALAIFKRRPAYWFKSMLLIGTGMVLMVSPWIWRNWRTTGIVYFDSPHFRTDLIAERYSSTPEEPNTTKQPEETAKEYTDRMSDSAADFVRENPEEVSSFILNHFFNSEIQMALMFPTTFRFIDSAIGYLGHHSGAQFWEECCSPSNYIRRLPFWHKWTGALPKQSIVPILITLFLAAIGLSKSWDRNRAIGLVPLIISVAYLSVNALVRNSGGRYVLAVDWTGIIYYSIGLAHITIKGISYFHDKKRLQLVLPSIGEMDGPITNKDLTSIEKVLPLNKSHLAIATLILLIGCALPIAEQAFPQRYTDASQAARLDDILANEDNLLDPGEVERLEYFIGNDGKVIEGRALYPRNFTAKRGETGQGWLEKKAQPAFHLQPYSRTIFYMVGPRNITVVLRGARKVKLPNASDVLVIGCPRSGTIDAIAVIVYPPDGSGEYALVRDPLPAELSCPLGDPE